MGKGLLSGSYDSFEESQCEELSERRRQYVIENSEKLKKQCGEFQNCINELLSMENIHSVIQGDDIRLGVICRFLYPEKSNNNSEASDGCTDDGRAAITDNLDKDLEDTMVKHLEENIAVNNHTEHWRQLNKCLQNETSFELREREGKHIQPICRTLTENRQFCPEKGKLHDHLQGFLNHQLEHQQCTCININKVNQPLPKLYRRLIFGGSILFILLLPLIIYCICRRRRIRRKKIRRHQEETLRRVEYHRSKSNLTAGTDTNPYSDCEDSGGRFDSNSTLPVANRSVATPPALPPRYSTYILEELGDAPVPDFLVDGKRRLQSPDGASIEDVSYQKAKEVKMTKDMTNYGETPYSDVRPEFQTFPSVEKNPYYTLEQQCS